MSGPKFGVTLKTWHTKVRTLRSKFDIRSRTIDIPGTARPISYSDAVLLVVNTMKHLDLASHQEILTALKYADRLHELHCSHLKILLEHTDIVMSMTDDLVSFYSGMTSDRAQKEFFPELDTPGPVQNNKEEDKKDNDEEEAEEEPPPF